ncbi:MAG: hypothetical protein ACRENP_12510 [Longimicrobiales bacterium]
MTGRGYWIGRHAHRAVLLAALLLAAGARPGRAQIFAEGFMGSALSVPLPLHVTQSGSAELRFTAKYETRPLEGSPYYAWRIGYWRSRRGWAVGLLHHKLYLTNAPSAIQRFEVSHGYNLVAVTHGWLHGSSYFGVGGGVVIAHPETVVRGRTTPADGGPLGGGYYLTGPSLQGAAGRYVLLTSFLALALEAGASASRARLPVAGGHANVPNLAMHFHVGLKLHRG